MSWRTPDDSPTTAEQRAATELHGTPHPDRTDADQLHDDALEDADRAYRHAPLAYVEAPSPRERREHYDETRVANTLRPRTGNVQVQPRGALSATAGAPPACHASADEGLFPEPASPLGVGRRTERTVPCTCGAATRGLRLAGPGHKYACPAYASHVDYETEAA